MWTIGRTRLDEGDMLAERRPARKRRMRGTRPDIARRANHPAWFRAIERLAGVIPSIIHASAPSRRRAAPRPDRQRTQERPYKLVKSIPFPPWLLFAALALAPFFWDSADSAYRYMGADDYLSPVDIAASFRYAIYPFDHLNAAGLDQAFLVAMLPVYAYYYVMDALGATAHFSTLFLMALLLFAAQASFFASLRYFLVRRLEVHNGVVACALGAIFYGFSPYMAAQVLPGHNMSLVIYSVFPLVVRYLDELLVAQGLGTNAPLALFVIFAIASPSLANIGTLYVVLIAGGLYALALLLTHRLPFWRTAVRTVLFAILPFIANGWWIAAHFYDLPRYITRSRTFGGEMVNLVAYASKDASIANVFQGRPESTVYLVDLLGHGYYINAFQSAIFLALTAFLVWAALSRSRQVYAMLLAALLALMFMKGVQPPFSDVFVWAYNNIPGFQVMRRPTAKMYGIFLFFFLACATFGIAMAQRSLAERKWTIGVVHAVLGAAAGYVVFSFAAMSGMRPFNIPPMYFEARDYLIGDRVERALVLPAIAEARPLYRPGMNSYSGMDFATELWRFPKIAPGTVELSSDAGYLGPTKELLQLIRGNHSICGAARGLGLSHVVVREDLAASVEQYPARVLARNLDQHPDVVPGRKFVDDTGARLSVYRLKPECAGRLLELHGSYASFSYEMLNPGLIKLNVAGLAGPAQLTFLTDYSTHWHLVPDPAGEATAKGPTPRTITAAYNTPGGDAMDFEEVRYLFTPSPFRDSHRPSAFANAWTLPAGGGNLSLVLYYRPQGILLLGTLASLVVLLLLVARPGVSLLRRKQRSPFQRGNEAR
jgi:hypothetical protein